MASDAVNAGILAFTPYALPSGIPEPAPPVQVYVVFALIGVDDSKVSGTSVFGQMTPMFWIGSIEMKDPSMMVATAVAVHPLASVTVTV